MAAECARRFGEGLVYLLYVAPASLGRLEAAQFALEREAGGHGVARTAPFDAPDQNARLVVGERAVGIGRVAEDFERVDRLREIFARMPGASADVHLESLVHRA